MFFTFFFLKKLSFSHELDTRYAPRLPTRKHPSSGKGISGAAGGLESSHFSTSISTKVVMGSSTKASRPLSISPLWHQAESLAGALDVFSPFSPEWCSVFHDLDWCGQQPAHDVCYPCFSDTTQVPTLSLSTLHSWGLREKQPHRQL